MVFSVFDIYYTDVTKGFSVFYLRCGTTETALLGFSLNKTPYGIAVSADICFLSLVVNTVKSIADIFRGKSDESKEESK